VFYSIDIADKYKNYKYVSDILYIKALEAAFQGFNYFHQQNKEKEFSVEVAAQERFIELLPETKNTCFMILYY
jgi:hypothetical protein